MRTSCPHGETTNRSVDGDDPDRPPIGGEGAGHAGSSGGGPPAGLSRRACPVDLGDRKSTRLNSSHGYISYAVFCLKKKKQNTITPNSHVSRQHEYRVRRVKV